MKKFNIVKQDVILWGHHIPVNACYGCFTCTYKKYIKTEQVTTKRGQIVYKKRFQTVTEDVIYYVDNFNPLKFKNYGSIRIHVYDKEHDRWIDTHTAAHDKHHDLQVFLLQMFIKNNIKPDRKCIHWVDYRTGRPHEKRAQVHSDSIFNTSVGYALSKNVITAHNINGDGWNSYDKSSCGGI